MILAPAAIVDPLDPAVLNEDQELDALAQSLRVSNGFKLFLAVCNSPLQRGRLIDRLRERLPEIKLQHLRLDMRIDQLLGELQERIDCQADAVAVDGLELSLGDADHAARSPLVAHLNAARNSFPEALNRPLVLWLPRYGLTAVMQGAPDFGSIRSGTFFFAEPPDRSHPRPADRRRLVDRHQSATGRTSRAHRYPEPAAGRPAQPVRRSARSTRGIAVAA
jgi:hypothetical protein